MNGFHLVSSPYQAFFLPREEEPDRRSAWLRGERKDRIGLHCTENSSINETSRCCGRKQRIDQ